MKKRAPFSNLDDAPSSRAAGVISVFGSGRGPARRSAPRPEADVARFDPSLLRHDPEQIWAGLANVVIDPDHAAEHHLIVTHEEDPVGLLYDHLRTRLLQAMQAQDWRTVMVCAPTRGCGASTVAANLALSLSRRPSGRSLLMDFDFRQPTLAGLFGVTQAGPLRSALNGTRPLEDHLGRVGRTLALGLNDRPEKFSAELLQEPATATSLAQICTDLQPDVVIYDMPPFLESDDVLSFMGAVDAVLLVADGTRTTAAHIKECERLMEGHAALLGVVMNRADDSPARGRRRR